MMLYSYALGNHMTLTGSAGFATAIFNNNSNIIMNPHTIHYPHLLVFFLTYCPYSTYIIPDNQQPNPGRPRVGLENRAGHCLSQH
jgi:phosphotransferase system  glucose/maltose/N-acetylglucosamine-specific IIC component